MTSALATSHARFPLPTASGFRAGPTATSRGPSTCPRSVGSSFGPRCHRQRRPRLRGSPEAGPLEPVPALCVLDRSVHNSLGGRGCHHRRSWRGGAQRNEAPWRPKACRDHRAFYPCHSAPRLALMPQQFGRTRSWPASCTGFFQRSLWSSGAPERAGFPRAQQAVGLPRLTEAPCCR